MIRKWDIKNEQAKRQCVETILARIDEQGDADFGIIAGEEIIDLVAPFVGPEAYNAGLEDAKKALQAKLADLEIDIDILKVKT